MRLGRFLLFDGLGALLWVGGFVGLGLLFSEQLEGMAALTLRHRGIARVRPLLGGIQGWRERGFPFQARGPYEQRVGDVEGRVVRAARHSVSPDGAGVGRQRTSVVGAHSKRISACVRPQSVTCGMIEGKTDRWGGPSPR